MMPLLKQPINHAYIYQYILLLLTTSDVNKTKLKGEK